MFGIRSASAPLRRLSVTLRAQAFVVPFLPAHEANTPVQIAPPHLKHVTLLEEK